MFVDAFVSYVANYSELYATYKVKQILQIVVEVIFLAQQAVALKINWFGFEAKYVYVFSKYSFHFQDKLNSIGKLFDTY